jgi:TetR/AcrR family transcriptional regulator, mexJK operon transcriptional repressor
MGRPARVSREEVLRAAREAFGERGYDGTTLADIASRVGLSPAALLRHAPGKEALFAAALASGQAGEPFPMAFLAEVDPAQDPRRVLRRFAEVFVPFLEAKMGQSIALWLRSRVPVSARTIRLPFDPRAVDSPPRRVLALLEEYFRRAARAGRLRLADPRAAAMGFMGSFHAYVFLHQVLKVQDPPLPLARYVDAVLDVWTRGAIVPRRRSRAKKKP